MLFCPDAVVASGSDPKGANMQVQRRFLAGRCGIPSEFDRMYVQVDTVRDGGALASITERPVCIHWPDGRSWAIDSVYNRREFGREVFGNLCVRWSVRIGCSRRELFWEHGGYFVAKRSSFADCERFEG